MTIRCPIDGTEHPDSANYCMECGRLLVGTDRSPNERPEAPGAAWVYLLRCADGTYYTGLTRKLRGRLEAHAEGKGAAYTRTRLPVALVAARPCASLYEASVVELEVKARPAVEKAGAAGWPGWVAGREVAQSMVTPHYSWFALGRLAVLSWEETGVVLGVWRPGGVVGYGRLGSSEDRQ